VVLTSQRIFLESVKKYCLAHDIAIEVRSGGWLVIMQRGSQRRVAFGYDVGLNSAVAHQVANDKSACVEVLKLAGVACIPHTLFLGSKLSAHIPGSGSLEAMLTLLDQHPQGLVVKPNEGTSGELVFRVTTRAQLEQAVARIFSSYPSLAISPYVEIKSEIRFVVLDDRVLLAYIKLRPSVFGDGVHSLRELMQRTASADQLKVIADDFSAAELDAIPPAGKLRDINWRHNLEFGAEPVLLKRREMQHFGLELAMKAAQAVRIRFASIDVVETDGQMHVLEVNSGVKMEVFGKRAPDLVEAVYEQALDKVFE
jgi:glutathione synthase/RimK-type ligase-like ATP-grasp enzyme